jgi:hypothetical protein
MLKRASELIDRVPYSAVTTQYSSALLIELWVHVQTKLDMCVAQQNFCDSVPQMDCRRVLGDYQGNFRAELVGAVAVAPACREFGKIVGAFVYL